MISYSSTKNNVWKERMEIRKLKKYIGIEFYFSFRENLKMWKSNSNSDEKFYWEIIQFLLNKLLKKI